MGEPNRLVRQAGVGEAAPRRPGSQAADPLAQQAPQPRALPSR